MSQSGPQPDRAPLPLEVEQQIDRVSDEFERAWRSAQTPRIEDYLDRVPAVGRLQLLEELLAVEFDLRQQQNPPLDLDIDAYRRRFPGSDAVINAALALHERRQQDDLPRTAIHRAVTDADEEKQPLPQQIGRFLIRRRLGKGGFGVVYLAHDPGLDRLVALKVPRTELLATGQQRESFLHEARTAAKLKHPSLVTVYEVQQETDLIYIVQEYIEGQNLAQWAAAQPRSWEDLTRRLIEITTAIGYVHQQGFYHRDLKPGNILIDNEGHAHVADFGLAVHEDALRVLKGKAPGTPPYMSPEQCRGETHWIDGRTDIWALGVILYELLAGRRPFAADSVLELFTEIQERDPKSPRMKNPDIPRELERICFKCLAKRRTQRYANASDLREDLQAFLETCADSKAAAVTDRAAGASVDPGLGVAAVAGSTVGPDADSTPRPATPTPDSGSQPPLKIVPKGLRSFDKEDRDFFLELLPGPRDRKGLPDSIRFWKTRIEEMDADATFAVGVMYGPSGCGKSSLLKAGLLPRLADHVLPIFIEATPNDTELRLLKQLRKHLPRLTGEASLTEALAQLREGRIAEGRKVLLVLDQFEQWLHATATLNSSQLVRALRQCDGANVQCLILVRDDFWMSTTRFMQSLEILQLEGMNSAAVDLFDPSHAQKVLRAFGLAYSRLPEHVLSAEEQRFLDRAVRDLAQDGKVICVQLSLFADMMKGRPWTPASLQEVGGTSGVGVAFLDETFTAKTSPPTHRLHAKAAQAVLKALLPEVDTDIMGQMQPAERLLEYSGYATRPDDFRDLLHILIRELRLITQTDPGNEVVTVAHGLAPNSSLSSGQRAPFSTFCCYQLTHDYLVPSLRDWLTLRQRETRCGRARLKLHERSALWGAKSESRHLPSWWEMINIIALTRRSSWTSAQRAMMRTASWHHGLRWSVMLLMIVLALSAAFLLWWENARNLAIGAVTDLSNAPPTAVRYAIDKVKPVRRFALDVLHRQFNDSENPSFQLRAAVAMVELQDDSETLRKFLIDSILQSAAGECPNIVTALQKSQPESLAEIKQRWVQETDLRSRARLAIVAMYLGNTDFVVNMLAVADDPTPRTVFINECSSWHGSVSDLAAVASETHDSALRSGVCLVLGRMSAETTPEQERGVVQRVLGQLWSEADDAGTHSAAGWALRRWSAETAASIQDFSVPLSRDWYVVEGVNLTMLKVSPVATVSDVNGDTSKSVEPPFGKTPLPQPGTAPTAADTPSSDLPLDELPPPPQAPLWRLKQAAGRQGEIPRRPYYLSDCEVTVSQLRRFINDSETRSKPPELTFEEAPGETTSPDDHPAHGISWFHAIVFCNWLSAREGRIPCYERTGKRARGLGALDAEYEVWRLNPTADGYRLPSISEWEFACRAMSHTDYSFGDDASFLEAYAVYFKETAAPVGCSMPNAWGFFEMHGNVSEWCQDAQGPIGSWAQEYATNRLLKGGSFADAAVDLRSASVTHSYPTLPSVKVGFRVARYVATSTELESDHVDVSPMDPTWTFEEVEVNARHEIELREERRQRESASGRWSMVNLALTKALAESADIAEGSLSRDVEFACFLLRSLPIGNGETAIPAARELLLHTFQTELHSQQHTRTPGHRLRLLELRDRLRAEEAYRGEVYSFGALLQGGVSKSAEGSDTFQLLIDAQKRLNECELGLGKTLLALLPVDDDDPRLVNALATVDTWLKLRILEANRHLALVSWRYENELQEGGAGTRQSEARARALVRHFDAEIHSALASLANLQKNSETPE